MIELKKIKHEVFSNYYIGENGNKKVIAILDTNCIRYMVIVNGKQITRREYANGNESICLKNATKALNK